MKTRLIAALLVAVSAAVAAPAFASGYGPAPFYRPSVGAPASQRGVSAQTFAAERNQVAANEAVGGVTGALSESGSRQPAQAANDVNVFKGH
ncbi:hypothetical protein [Paraburkholderia sp. XV]|uniref:hypothetical protein n=1 Tax=Paraburkholderia sp. XV TaxID=2831520 RepID=UPI001CD78276|nr:hypothetical protein [Paraburkholderia sp. XV]